MADQRDIAAAEQAVTWMGKSLPQLWKSLYDNMIEEGFTEPQAFTLLLTYVGTAYRPPAGGSSG